MRLVKFNAAVFLSVALLACAKEALTPPGAPLALRVAKDEVLRLEAFANGAQLYECGPAGRWVRKGADAELTDRDGKKLGTLSSGPAWEARDGGKVTGAARAEEPGRRSDDLPWVLFTASSAPRGGVLGRTSSIQQMDTVGGGAPGGSCTQGDRASVPYRATYYFYRHGK
ncbi:MAG TPA: DUF3455 domain-containing protein [Burkholderiales bacterium]